MSDPEISIIIPARNEERNLGPCLESLVPQQGVTFEIFVVDDHSTDGTAAVARQFPAVHLIPAAPLPPDWTGKANAIQTAIPLTRGRWLLFTDADTVHLPGSLARAVAEAKQYGVSLLSYSPLQATGSFWERAVQPVIFGELAREFSYDEVSRPESPQAAANGQYILVAREPYEAVGGHARVKGSLLEDVELARAIKQVGKLRFRYAPDAVSARMYRGWSELVAGWTKNVALLFPSPIKLAALRALESTLLLAGPFAALILFWWGHLVWGGLLSLVVLASGFSYANRLRRAGWHAKDVAFSVLGLPIFAYLLIRSVVAHRVRGKAQWKGRNYPT
jgi:glycosyltransferase involved in cell wall biosynthesis